MQHSPSPIVTMPASVSVVPPLPPVPAMLPPLPPPPFVPAMGCTTLPVVAPAPPVTGALWPPVAAIVLPPEPPVASGVPPVPSVIVSPPLSFAQPPTTSTDITNTFAKHRSILMASTFRTHNTTTRQAA